MVPICTTVLVAVVPLEVHLKNGESTALTGHCHAGELTEALTMHPRWRASALNDTENQLCHIVNRAQSGTKVRFFPKRLHRHMTP